MKLATATLLALLAVGAGCKDVQLQNDLADAKKTLAEREDALESSQKKLKAAESASNAAEERAKVAESQLKESDAKLKVVEAKLKAQTDASIVSDPDAPAKPASVDACDKYWKTFRACNEAALKNAPASARAAIQKSLDDAEKQTKDAWKNMDAAAMTMACETMVDALKQNPNCPK